MKRRWDERMPTIMAVQQGSRLLLLAGLLALAWRAFAGGDTGMFVDRDVCPFECCTYGQWQAVEPVSVYPQHHAGQAAFEIAAGERVTALTGNVYVSQPGTVRVRRDYASAASGKRYAPGDQITVYSYQGEGFYKVQVGKDIYSEELSFLAGWDQCEESSECWGEVIELPQSQWWVRMRTQAGKTGWLDGAEAFMGTDSCH